MSPRFAMLDRFIDARSATDSAHGSSVSPASRRWFTAAARTVDMCSAVRSIRDRLTNRHADFRNETAHRLSVLVVDDEESVRAFVERVLRDAGYEVTVASDGPDALKIVEQHGPFDVFVLDVMMPQMRGDELSRQFRVSDLDVKVLYFTGYSE